MFCSNCGAENNKSSRFCHKCGQELQASPGGNDQVTEDLPEMTENNITNDEDNVWADFVGKNYQYYKFKWLNMDDPIQSISWNWPAFFFGIFWLGYRKMYKPIFILIGVFLASDLLEIITGYHPLATQVVTSLPLILYVFLGMHANALYYKHAQAEIAKTKDLFPDGSAVKYAGGTSSKGVAAAFAIFIGYLFVLGTLYTIFPDSSIVFGTSEGNDGVTDIKEIFSVDEGIYYEVNFGERIETSAVDVHVLLEEDGAEVIYAQFEEWVEPSWEGFYNYLYDPDFDYLEPGKYIIRVYRANELLSEGAFEMQGLLY